MPQLTSAPAEATRATGPAPCPRCGQPLIDPGGLGWCKACGYCHSLAEPAHSAVPQIRPAAKQQTAPPPVTPSIGTKWLWVMLLGMVLVGAATCVGARYLTLSPLDRALLTTVQIGGSLLLMFFAQFIGLMKIAPEEPSLSFKDAVFPFRLYPLALKRLPKTRLTIYGGAWGVTAIATAVIFIGGLGHWFTYLPGNQKNHPHQVQKVKSGR